MVPLTLLVILPIFKPSSFHWSNISGFHYADAKTAGTVFFLAWIFVISWNAIAMEAAACYIGECRDPARDAKIALTAEGLYGVFIYIATAVVFVGVLGCLAQVGRPAHALHQLLPTTSSATRGWVKYLIGIPLIFALLLSVLNAIMGVARSLFQASEDRLLPKFFEHQNKHHVPDRAMAFNVVCAILVGLFGSPRPHLHLLERGLHRGRGRVALRVLPDAPDAAGADQPLPHAGVLPVDRPGLRALPHLRLLRRRVELTRHRGWARAAATSSTSWVSSSWPPTSRSTSGGSSATSGLGIDCPTTMPLVVGSPGGIDLERHRPQPHIAAESERWLHADHVGHECRDRAVTLAPPDQTTSGNAHPVRSKFGRRKFDKQPTQPAAVLIATNGVRFRVRPSARRSDSAPGEPVAIGPSLASTGPS